MAKISIEELFRGDKYDVNSETFKDFWHNFQNCEDEVDMMFLLTVKHTVLATLKLIKNRESISELETEMDSFYMEVLGEDIR
ncbi:MAG: hypothetical protein R3Y35_13550 [Clostridia bacterium]